MGARLDVGLWPPTRSGSLRPLRRPLPAPPPRPCSKRSGMTEDGPQGVTSVASDDLTDSMAEAINV